MQDDRDQVQHHAWCRLLLGVVQPLGEAIHRPQTAVQMRLETILLLASRRAEKLVRFAQCLDIIVRKGMETLTLHIISDRSCRHGRSRVCITPRLDQKGLNSVVEGQNANSAKNARAGSWRLGGSKAQPQ